ncbi:DNA-J related domain-containing protein [Candidatus Albibeggiatoa sp. nov. NOAA]|uniref:DNA-J related domain-containing protein n=1 Tax=Candidatus Albibeggiatoa sp. nov. NOAA TaxID=3162724 RepID=UPI0032F20EB0|nr:DnaJ domain-containing protein [Thiotrichaceae bacterium]
MCEKKLTEIVLNILRQHPQGLGEFELLKTLQANQIQGFPNTSLTESYPLFKMHFLLFHTLYKLRRQLWQQQTAYLEISALNIQLLPYHAGEAALTEHDPLEAYYLDISHLQTTTEQDVEELITNFWVLFHAGEQKMGALELLGLKEPTDYQKIKKQYRKLVSQYHPDHGGDEEKLQAINVAMDILEKYYKK